LGEKYGRSEQAIRQFSARNAAEIAIRRQALLGEVDIEAAHLWVSNKAIRIAQRQKLAEGLERHLADDDLDPKLVVRLTGEYNALLRAVAEEKSELRTQISLESPAFEHSIIGWDQDKWQAEMMIERGWIPPAHERPVRSADGSTPAPAPAPPAASRDMPTPATTSRAPLLRRPLPEIRSTNRLSRSPPSRG